MTNTNDSDSRRLNTKRFLVRFQNGDEAGPFGAADLKTLAESGNLERKDLVSVEGSNQWVKACHVQGLVIDQTEPETIESTSASDVDLSGQPRRHWFRIVAICMSIALIAAIAMLSRSKFQQNADPVSRFEEYVACFMEQLAVYQEANWDVDVKFLYFDNFDVIQTDSLKHPISGKIIGKYRDSVGHRYHVEVDCIWNDAVWVADSVGVRWMSGSSVITPMIQSAKGSVMTAIEESGAAACGGP